MPVHAIPLAPPRFAPCPSRGRAPAVWYDRDEDRFLAFCPRCRELIAYATLSALHHELVTGEKRCCQGCRARTSFEKNPGLIGSFLEFWRKTDSFPQSTSWLEGIPENMLTFWTREIRAALGIGKMSVRKGGDNADLKNAGGVG